MVHESQVRRPTKSPLRCFCTHLDKMARNRQAFECKPPGIPESVSTHEQVEQVLVSFDDVESLCSRCKKGREMRCAREALCPGHSLTWRKPRWLTVSAFQPFITTPLISRCGQLNNTVHEHQVTYPRFHRVSVRFDYGACLLYLYPS
jgi:hypothetical protein